MNKWIPVMVRIEDYAEFTAEVRAREARRLDESGLVVSLATARDLPDPVSPKRGEEWLAMLRPWSVVDLRQIIETADQYKTMARWAMALDVVSQHPGVDGFRSSTEVAAAAGMTITEWRDAPRKLPRHLKVHFPDGLEMPLRAMWGRDLGRDDQFYWGITPEQATRWMQARAEASR